MLRIKHSAQEQWRFSFAPVLKGNLVLCLLVCLLIALFGLFQAKQNVTSAVHSTLLSGKNQIAYRVAQSLNLLESLAAQPEFYEPHRPPEAKAAALNVISKQFGYMLTHYVDADVNVHSVGEEPASLASRGYMQRLFSTGKPQVTDSFAAGADGVTLNYTVAVPLFYKGEIVGCLFCAIYFDEVEDLMREMAFEPGIEGILIGRRGQIMSSTEKDKLHYGDPFLDEVRASILLGTSKDKIEEQLLGRVSGSYWSIRGADLSYVEYARVEGTEWDLICMGSLWAAYAKLFPVLLPFMGLVVLACGGLLWVMRRYVRAQMQVVDMLVQSVQELEEKIYRDERPDNLDFKEVLRLTSTGLSDGLTGVVTRSVFLSQLKEQLKNVKCHRLLALCFVDLDDLKTLNDTYGHGVGDRALKSIGYVLREFEKKYDGLVGRYGGDEFILLLDDLDDEKELRDVLDELVLRLHLDVGEQNNSIPIHCSIGVSLYRAEAGIDTLIAEADESLYFVKQNGKGYYKIYQS